MTREEKAIRDFCGHHADWWPSITQVQEMLALAQPKQEQNEPKEWVGLTVDQMRAIGEWQLSADRPLIDVIKAVQQALKEKNT